MLAAQARPVTPGPPQQWAESPTKPRRSNEREKGQIPGEPTLQIDGLSGVRPQVEPPARAKSRTYKAADLAYRRLELQIEHPDLSDALRLQHDEAERFFDLLARQQAGDAEWEQSAEASGDSSQRERERRRQENKAEQAAFLGEARVADWNNYTNSLGARAEGRELRILLVETDYPLRRDQYDQLVTMIASEQSRHHGEREQLRHHQRDPTFPTPEETIRYMDQRLSLIEESLARRRRAAQSALDTEQMRQYEKMLELERLRAQADYDSTVTLNAMATQKPGASR